MVELYVISSYQICKRMCVFDGLADVGSVKKEDELLVFGRNELKWGKKEEKGEKKGFRAVDQETEFLGQYIGLD